MFTLELQPLHFEYFYFFSDTLYPLYIVHIFKNNTAYKEN